MSDILVVSSAGFGVKNAVSNIISTESWGTTDTTHLTLPTHVEPERSDQRAFLDERLIQIAKKYQPLYLLYAIFFFWIQAYVYIWQQSSEYDAVWLHNPRLLFLLPAEKNAVITYHGPLNLEKAGSHRWARRTYYKVFGWIERIGIYRHRSAIYTGVSAEIVETLEKYGVAPDQTRVVFNGVDIDRFFRQQDHTPEFEWTSAERDVFLFVGRLSPEKGLLRLLRTFEVLLSQYEVKPRPSLVLVGNGPLRKKLESIIDSRELSTIKCIGYVNHNRLPTVYSSADYFILPSKYEGASMPLALCEALASGLPAFVSEIDPLSTIAEEEFVTAVDFDNYQNAAKTICEESLERDDWLSLSDGARQFAEEELSWEHRAEQYLDVFGLVWSK